MKKFAVIIFLIFFIAACQTEKVDNRAKNIPVSLRVVYPPDLNQLMQDIKLGFEKFSAEGIDPVELQLMPEHSIQAANKIASGQIKADVWLTAPSQTIDFANSKIANLGAKQDNCKEVFASPIVVATQERFVASFKDRDLSFSWNDFFDIVVYATTAGNQLASPTFTIAGSDHSISGLASILSLVHLAGGSRDGVISVEDIKKPEFKSRLDKYLNKISYYGQRESAVLNRASSAHSRIFFAMTSEQQVMQFNMKNSDPEKKIFALYPEEGSVWLDYKICISDADWVSAQQKAAYVQLGAYLSTPAVQKVLINHGYRVPLTEANKNDFTIFRNYGALPYLPKENRITAQSGVLDYILKNKQNFKRANASIYLLDVSGTTTGNVLSTGKSMMRGLLANSSSKDISALISFAEEVRMLEDFSNDHATKIASLDREASGGGSAVYDAVAFAVKRLEKEDLSAYRKSLYIFTDGKDNDSKMSLNGVLDLIRESRRYQDINVEIVVMQQEGVDISDIEKIAAAFNANLYKTTMSTVDKVIVELVTAF